MGVAVDHRVKLEVHLMVEMHRPIDYDSQMVSFDFVMRRIVSLSFGQISKLFEALLFLRVWLDTRGFCSKNRNLEKCPQ